MIIFATVFGVGFAILLTSLVFGGDAEVDVDVDTDIGFQGPSIFSLKMLSLLMVGFGAVGFGVRSTTDWTMFQASMTGIGGAVGVGLMGYFILKLFYSSQASSTIIDQHMTGAQGHVIDTITGTNYGQVTFSVRGREITFMARSNDSNTIEKRTPVKIVSKTGNIVTVTEIHSEIED